MIAASVVEAVAMILRSALIVFAIFLCPSIGATDEIDAKADAILQKALANKNPDTRKQAVVALSLAASRDPYLSRLIRILEDKDVEVRLAVVSSLSDIKNKAVSAALRKALQDEVPEVSFAAAKALWALGDSSGKRALMAVLEGENKASSSFLSKQTRDALRMMHTPRTALLFAARQGAAFAPIPGLGGGISSMQAILTDPAVSGRAAAALLLGQQNDPATLQALKDALKEKDSSLRAAAVHSLALKNNLALKKDIAPLLEDEKEAVRLSAAAAYVRLSAIQGKRVPPKGTAPAIGQAAFGRRHRADRQESVSPILPVFTFTVQTGQSRKMVTSLFVSASPARLPTAPRHFSLSAQLAHSICAREPRAIRPSNSRSCSQLSETCSSSARGACL